MDHSTFLVPRLDNPEHYKVVEKLLEKGYPIGCTKILSKEYMADAQDNGIVTGKEYKNKTTGHRSSFYLNKDYVTTGGATIQKIAGTQGKFAIWNSFYGSLKRNYYVVESLLDLVKSGMYYPAVYIIVPTKFLSLTPEQIKENKRKEIEKQYSELPHDMLMLAK